jgi:hypothetical protein
VVGSPAGVGDLSLRETIQTAVQELPSGASTVVGVCCLKFNLFSAEVKNAWTCTSSIPTNVHGVHRDKFTFILCI